MEWEFQVNQPGKFNLSAEIATEAATRFQVEVGGQKLAGAAPHTGGYTSFQKLELGELDLPKGPVTVRVRAVANGWQPLNLKSLLLQPKR